MNDLLTELQRFSDTSENLSLYMMQIAKLGHQLNGAVDEIVRNVKSLDERVQRLEQLYGEKTS